MRSVGFLALDREKIGTKLYGYVLAKRYTRSAWRLAKLRRPRVHDRNAEGGKLFTGHVARVIGRVQLDQYSVRVSELEAFF